jgi:hypothetical protein
MADLTVTASAVRGTRGETALASVTLTAGKVVNKDANGKWQLADSNVVALASFVGITLAGGDADQPVPVHQAGNLTVQGGLTAGTFYYMSSTPGGICPFADLASGARVIQIGYATSATNLVVNVIDTGIVLP